jgi:hypothetical protein
LFLGAEDEVCGDSVSTSGLFLWKDMQILVEKEKLLVDCVALKRMQSA